MSLLVDIKKDFGRFRLDAHFEAGNGEVTGLLGASGCGKSVTLKCVAGIEKPDEGRIVLDGRVLFDSEKRIDLTPQQRRVGYLFQNYALFPNMTLAQNIAVGVRDRSKRRETVERLVKSFYLEGCEGKYPRQLSGGQQQRTALARILASEPEVLMLDEPFSALDSYLKWQVELELADLLDKFPGPVLFVTHDRDEVHRLCSRVCVLDSGRAQAMQSVMELFNSPRTLSACLLSGCKNISRARKVSEHRVEAVDWKTELEVELPLPEELEYVGIRAHFVKPVDGPGPNRVRCRVERVVTEAFSTVIMMATEGGCEGYARLRMELPQEQWESLGGPGELCVELSPDDILPLTKS